MDNYMLNINGELRNRVVNIESIYGKEDLLKWLEKNQEMLVYMFLLYLL